MLNRLILKVNKFQLPPPKRLSTVVKNILGGHHAPPPMSNRVKTQLLDIDTIKYDSNTAFHCETWSFSQGISFCYYQVRTMELLYGFDSLSALVLITECMAVAQARLLHHLSLEKHHGL